MLFLIGFMATGKSTLGKALQRAVPGLRFIDLDKAVEAAAGCSIPEIFATRGEEAFRQLEAKVLREAAAPRTVIACGGGTPCHAGNMDFMLSAGKVVRLDASADTIVRRLLEAPKGSRPLVDGFDGRPAELKKHVEAMLESRRGHYMRAPFCFDANRLDNRRQVDEAVAAFREAFLVAES